METKTNGENGLFSIYLTESIDTMTTPPKRLTKLLHRKNHF